MDIAHSLTTLSIRYTAIESSKLNDSKLLEGRYDMTLERMFILGRIGTEINYETIYFAITQQID